MDDLSEEYEQCVDVSIKDASNFDNTINTNLSNDTYEDEEVFFGPVSDKEEKLIEMWKNRKTEYYSPSRFQNLDINAKKDKRRNSSLAQDSDIHRSLNCSYTPAIECQSHDMANADENTTQVTGIELDECEEIMVKSDVRYEASVEYCHDQLIEDLDNHLKCTQNCNVSLNLNCKKDEILNDSNLSRCSNQENQDSIEDNESNKNLTKEFAYKEHSDDSEGRFSADDNEEVSRLTYDLERFLELKKSFSTSELNDLNKPDKCNLKRESYFTSLQIINVHDKQFDDFTLDSLECNASVSICYDGVFKNIENDNIASIKIPVKFSIDSLEENSDLRKSYLSSSDRTDNSEVTQPLHEDTIDSDYANNGILLSHSLSLKSSNTETSNCSMHHDRALSNDVSLQEECENHSQTPEESTNDYPDSPPSFSPPSPDDKFNDTIEEMEQLLACGINYYKDLGLKEESIHQPEEQTLSSTSSVHSFNPNFDSTHASSEMLKKYTKNYLSPDPLVMEKEELTEVSNKKPVPVKPPRIIISKSTPKPVCKRSPIYNCKLQKDNTPFQVHSPIVKSITKSKLESYTPLANKKDINSPIHSNTKKKFNITPFNTPKNINITPYNTPKSRGITTTVGGSSNKLVSNPTSTKFTPKSLILKSPVNRVGMSKMPKVTHENKLFRTPQSTIPKRKITASKSAQPTSRHRTLNIESPVANYLQNNPPPPLITTVKPRYKLSPLKSQIENLKKTPLKESNMPPKHEMMTSHIPPAVHKQGEGILVNKENISTKRMVPGDRPPVLVFKHKGRFQLPKNSVLKNEIDSPSLMANKRGEEKMNTERFSHSDSGRDSLMEISIYEQHLVRHANTLK